MQAIHQLWTGFILHLGLLVVATVYAVPIEPHLNNFYDSEAVELCVDKDDGVYSLGCIAEFVDCSQGQSFVMRCADGSVMDGDQGECVPRDASSICLKGGRSLSVEFIMKNIANTDVDVYRSQPVRSDFCSKRINGNYNIGCTSAFLTCVVGEPIAMECPKGMVFDDALSRCERSEYVTVCENSDRVPSKEDPPPSNDVFRVQRRVAMRSVSDSFIVSTTLPAATNIEATPSDHELCRGRPSGLYAKGCSGQALWCTDGVATVLSCPFGFLYEHNSRRCVPRESMAECPPELLPVIFAPSSTAWWAAPSSEPGLVAERRRIVPVNERSSADPKEVPSPDNINVACASLPDGVQSEGCSKFLITCVGQKAVVKECPSTLVYDITSGLCLSKDSVSSCAESPVVGSLQKVTTSDKVDSYISEKSEIFCEDHEDGIYGEDCSSRFFVCLSHETLHFNCPHSYVFDSSASHCSNVTSVPTCAETDPRDATSMRGSSLADTSQLTKGVSFEFLEDAEPDEDLREAVSTLGAMAQEVTVLKTSDESFGSACIGMPDGAISLGCSTDFIICAAEEARLHRCPFELKYDSQSQMCIHQIEVTACVEGAADLSLVSGLQRAYASTNMRQRSIGAATSGSRTRAVLSDRVKGSLTIQRPTLSSLPSMGTRMGGVGDTSDSRHTVQDANILLPKSVKYRTAKEEIAALANGGAQPDTRNTVVEGASGKIPIMASTSAFKTQVESFVGGEMNALVSSGSSANGYSYVPMTFTTEATVLSPSSYQAPTFPTVLEHLTEHAVPSSSKLEEQSTAALSMASSELSIPAGVGEVENSKVSVETVTENIITAEMPAVEGQSEMGTPTMLSKKNITAELAAEEKISGKAAERATLRSSEEKDAFSAPSDGSEAMVYDDGVVDEVAKESVEDAPVTEVSIDVITADEGEILAAALGEVALSSGDEKFSTGSTTIASAASLVESLSSSASPPSDTNRLILAATAGEAATLSLRRGSLENTGGATSKDQGTADWSMGWSLAPEVISSGQGKMVPVADNSALPAAGPSTEYVVSRPGDRAVPADEYAETTLVQISAFPSLAPLLPGENNAVPSSLKEEGDLIVNAAKMAVENGTVTTAVENSTKLLSKED
uniref:Chondroitin proteoglycan 2 n=1 Tax=Ascaris suum TaxID=6253 RepID=F1KQ65_ASCSU